MTEMDILQLAETMGFQAALINVEEIPVEEKFRAYCEENLCGQYGANYSCPPDCGSVEHLHNKLLHQKKALVLTTQWDIESYKDVEGIVKGKNAHNTATLELMEKLRYAGYEGFCVGSSCCSLCNPCKRTTGEPCVHPNKRYSCMSAYCVNVAKLAELCGMEFAWDTQKLYCSGMIVFH